MIPKGLFRQPKNELEKSGLGGEEFVEITQTCPKCGFETPMSDLRNQNEVCKCGYHFRMNARQRIALVTDEGSFRELFTEEMSKDVIGFPNYEEKLKQAKLKSGEDEAVICGCAKIGGVECALFVMEPNFMIGSMGTVVGEKITRVFEYATEKSLPVVGYTVSGGARMQEGIMSLMQMAKTSGAVKRHSDAGNLYVVVLTDPTTGGVSASFAMEGDIILSEPGALIGFAGPRVIEQTIRKKLPEGFQRAEFLLEHGFIDAIAPRNEQRELLSKILSIHEKPHCEEDNHDCL
ncbi:MAG: acetyl-CoA carboxylase, carboxyltransferase subunit beta [Clostridia bacterium]|nr:acetyl-CoA carboxylase, carboxyltransferase subunit beta [Clostridia bacterium]